MGAMTPPSRKSCYNFRVISIDKVLDGDTIDVTIDLGFDLYKKRELELLVWTRQRKELETLRKRSLGIHATNCKEKLDGAISGDDDLVIRTELVGGVGKYGRLLGWLYIGDSALSLNEQMIEEGYAWAYDGGTKQKDFEELREIRRAHGTLTE
ncbi:MAG: hypothetical protein CM15mV3_0900 [Caudoviricetes sp.]|nr:MAG: hypothetical protein CM15mV3_0900 [Caudoviricetes sp.]